MGIGGRRIGVVAHASLYCGEGFDGCGYCGTYRMPHVASAILSLFPTRSDSWEWGLSFITDGKAPGRCGNVGGGRGLDVGVLACGDGESPLRYLCLGMFSVGGTIGVWATPIEHLGGTWVCRAWRSTLFAQKKVSRFIGSQRRIYFASYGCWVIIRYQRGVNSFALCRKFDGVGIEEVPSDNDTDGLSRCSGDKAFGIMAKTGYG